MTGAYRKLLSSGSIKMLLKADALLYQSFLQDLAQAQAPANVVQGHHNALRATG